MPTLAALPSRMLYAKPVVRLFRRGEATSLDHYLGELDKATTVFDIVHPDELLLDLDGTTKRDKYRFTSLGFGQFAQEMAVGLSSLIPDIAGCDLRPDTDAAQCDSAVAIAMWNAVVALRFGTWRNKKVIRHTQNRLIEGWIGSLHCFLENRGLYQQTAEAIRLAPIPVEFFGASLIGRRMSLWYRTIQPVFKISIDRHPEAFWTGYYFCNAEATGTSLRATPAVFNRYGCCLGSFRGGGSVRHFGRSFARRAGRLFAQVVEQEPRIGWLQEHVESLLRTPLAVIGTSDERDKRRRTIVETLMRRGMKEGVATDLVESSLSLGRDVQNALHGLLPEVPRSFAGRTAYDLFCALLRQSKGLGPERREKTEQIAYELLCSKFKIQ